MEEALDNLPKSLEAMYEDVLINNVPEDYREEAKVMLMWLAYSYHPLRLQELAFVASVPEQNVLEICTSSLVTRSREGIKNLEYEADRDYEENECHEEDQDHEEDFVEFDHFSVKEYLVSERHSTGSWFYTPPMLAHLRIAATCVSNLLDPKTVQLLEKESRSAIPLWGRNIPVNRCGNPLLEYSKAWHFHVQDADSMSAQSE